MALTRSARSPRRRSRPPRPPDSAAIARLKGPWALDGRPADRSWLATAHAQNGLQELLLLVRLWLPRPLAGSQVPLAPCHALASAGSASALVLTGRTAAEGQHIAHRRAQRRQQGRHTPNKHVAAVAPCLQLRLWRWDGYHDADERAAVRLAFDGSSPGSRPTHRPSRPAAWRQARARRPLPRRPAPRASPAAAAPEQARPQRRRAAAASSASSSPEDACDSLSTASLHALPPSSPPSSEPSSPPSSEPSSPPSSPPSSEPSASASSAPDARDAGAAEPSPAGRSSTICAA
jgi:hypothetical protein